MGRFSSSSYRLCLWSRSSYGAESHVRFTAVVAVEEDEEDEEDDNELMLLKLVDRW
jgi:hypothetical protein